MRSPFRMLELFELSSFGNLAFLKLYIVLVYPLCVALIFFSTKHDRMLATKPKEKKLGCNLCMCAIAHVL